MRAVSLLGMPLLFTDLAGCTSVQDQRAPEPFDADQIRAAERRVTGALAAPDVTAWVDEYPADAVLLEPASPPVSGRDALLALARSMKPNASATIRSDHIEGRADIAAHRDGGFPAPRGGQVDRARPSRLSRPT